MARFMAPFRYWGAKARMAPWIADQLPEHSHFVDACCGSAAVLAAKTPSRFETVNDINGEVVNFFRVMRNPDDAEELIRLVAFTPYALDEFRSAFEIDAREPVVQAWAFFIRMQMAVVPGRSGWSYSKEGEAGHKANKPGRWASMPKHLEGVRDRFARVQITDWDILELIARLDAPGTLFFVDPPYLDESRPNSVGDGKTAYTHDSFDHVGFLNAAHSARHASFVVTHYPNELYDDAFGGAGFVDYVSHANIPSGGGRADRVERLYRLLR